MQSQVSKNHKGEKKNGYSSRTKEPTPLPSAIHENEGYYRRRLPISFQKTCECKQGHLNCLTAKEWLKCQLGVWEFFYQGRDIRDKSLHPATFPISLARKVIELFSHKGELVLDPFVGSGTTLVAARDLDRNAVGFDLQQKYVDLCASRLDQSDMFSKTRQVAIQDDARNIHSYLTEESVGLIWTSPPYANLLNRKRKNKPRRVRDSGQLGNVEQYSQDPRDLGTMDIEGLEPREV